MSCVDGTMDIKGLTGVLGDKWGVKVIKIIEATKEGKKE